MFHNDNTVHKSRTLGPSTLAILPSPPHIEQALIHMEDMPYTRMPYHIRAVAQTALPRQKHNFVMLTHLICSGMPHNLAPLPFKLALAYGVRLCHLLPQPK